MKNKTKRKVAALTLGSFFLMAMLSGCGSKDAEQEQTVSTVPVEVETVAVQDFDKVITLGGLTAAENTVNVIAKVSGMEQIKAVNVKVGDKVQEGQVLAQLDSETAQLNYDNAQLAVNNAENSIALDLHPAQSDILRHSPFQFRIFAKITDIIVLDMRKQRLSRESLCLKSSFIQF